MTKAFNYYNLEVRVVGADDAWRVFFMKKKIYLGIDIKSKVLMEMIINFT